MNVKKSVRALLCLYLTLIIAMDAVKAQALKVGDTVPLELWSMPLEVINHPTGKETITLEEYKDKLIILDFWATWCGTCIKSLSKLDTLQREFGGQLAIVPITNEPREKVLTFLTKRSYQLPSVFNDTLLRKHFPYRSVPHQVWVKAGVVLAITGAEYSTQENISKTLDNNSVQMIMKEDIFDLSEAPPQTTVYQSALKPRIKNYNSEILRNTNGINAYNVSLKALLLEAYSGEYSRHQLNSMVVWEMSDSLKKVISAEGLGFQGDYAKDTLYSQWLDRTLFCYTLALSPHLKVDKISVRKIIKHELTMLMRVLTGVESSIEKRTIEHLILVKEQPSVKSNVNSAENTATSQLVKILTYELRTPVIADASLGDTLKLALDMSSPDRGNIEQQLHRQGFALRSVMKETDTLVITTAKP